MQLLTIRVGTGLSSHKAQLRACPQNKSLNTAPDLYFPPSRATLKQTSATTAATADIFPRMGGRLAWGRTASIAAGSWQFNAWVHGALAHEPVGACVLTLYGLLACMLVISATAASHAPTCCSERLHHGQEGPQALGEHQLACKGARESAEKNKNNLVQGETKRQGGGRQA